MNYKYIALIVIVATIASYVFYLQVTNMKLSSKVREQEIVIASLDITVIDATKKLEEATILQALSYKLCDERLANNNEINKIKDKQNATTCTDKPLRENLVNEQSSKDSIAFINALLSGLQ